MRWKKPDISVFSTRERSGFLFLPMNIDGDIRWLESATWIEKCFYTSEHKTGTWWKPVEWKD